MLKLSSLILFSCIASIVLAQSPHGAEFNIECNVCHTPDNWKVNATQTKFNHNTTKFPLTGMHKSVDCRSCHVDLDFSKVKTDCSSCHADVHQQTVGRDCERCHTTNSWLVKNITQIHQQSRFPLVGPHALADCYSCHRSLSQLRFETMGIECIDCHREQYVSAPNHVSGNYSQECLDCHTMNSKVWSSTTGFSHDFFPLTQGHANLECAQCHGAVHKKVSPDCNGCHQKDYLATTNPSHSLAKFSTQCTTCHSTIQGWKPAGFDHNTNTNFPLTGGHIGVDCISCHANGFVGTPTTCVSCHLKDYNATTNPGHAAANFSKECTSCHTETTWKPGTFDHKSTGFPITGGHVGVDCISCHANGFVGTPTTCVSCHLKDYNATTNPGHAAANFSKECTSCHTETTWKPSTFDHNTSTSFQLKGGHVGVDCISCHANGFVGTPTTCVSCHLKDYNATTNPGHAAANFSKECTSCHTETTWKPSTFNHTSTGFPITGGHVGVDCISCHANGFVGTLTTCVSCHLKDYNATTNPGHAAANFSKECTNCHTETAWKPGTFDHKSTGFPITGGHVGVDCISCHANGFVSTPTTCVSCHLKDYNATTNPAHASTKFSTDCLACHNQSTWTTSTFNHDAQYFPIYSGRHRGQWTKCDQCHTNAANFAIFSCLTCHEHNKSETDSNHRGVGGYIYNSTNCLACHPRG